MSWLRRCFCLVVRKWVQRNGRPVRGTLGALAEPVSGGATLIFSYRQADDLLAVPTVPARRSQITPSQQTGERLAS